MKKLLLSLLFGVMAMVGHSQAINGVQAVPVCWTIGEVDSTLYAYWIFSSRIEKPLVKSYVNIQNEVVNVSGGTLTFGYCGQPTASTYLDSLGIEDCILSLYAQDGTVIASDSLPNCPGGDGGGDPSGNGMFDLYNQDSLWRVNRYYLPGQHYGYMRQKAGWVLQDSSGSRFSGENLIAVFASSGLANAPVVQMGSGNYIPIISTIGDTIPASGRIVFGVGMETYDLPIKDPDAYNLPPGEYFPTATHLGARGGVGGWTNIDSLYSNGFLDTTIVAMNLQAGPVETLTANRQVNFTLALPDTVTRDYEITLPLISDLESKGERFEHIMYAKYDAVGHSYAIVTAPGDLIEIGNAQRSTKKYVLADGERVRVTRHPTRYVIESIVSPVSIYFENEFTQGSYYERSEVNYKEGRYNLQKSLPGGLTLPNICVIPLKDKSPFGENLIYRSENFQDIGGANKWSAAGSIDNNVALDVARAPDGLYTADRFSVSAGSGFGTLKQTTTSSPDTRLRLGDPVTFSFYTKALAPGFRIQYISLQDAGAGNASIGGQASGFIVQNVRPGDEWQRYEYTTTVVLDSVVSPVVSFAFNLDSTFPEKTEVFDIYGVQLERTENASSYKRTFDTQSLQSDTLYATLKLDDSFVKLTDIYIPSNDAKAITEQAVAYCETTPGCEGVELADGMVYKEGNILIPENFTLKGKGKNTTEITYSPSDTTETLFISRDDVGAYIPGVEYKDFTVTVTDTCFSVINSRHGLETLFEQIRINGNYFPQYCVIVGDENEVASTRSNFFYSDIFSGRDAQVLYTNCGNNHRITGGTFSRGHTGLKSKVQLASLTVDRSDLEDNGITFDFSEGGGNSLEIINTYFEHETAFVGPDFKLGRYETVRFSGGFQTTSIFEMSDRMGTVSFYGVGFNLSTDFFSENGGLASPMKLTIADCSFNRSADALKVKNIYEDFDWFTMTGISATSDGADYRMATDVVNGIHSRNSKMSNVIIDGGVIGDEIRTTNLTLLGGEQNLARFSDSLAVPSTAEIEIDHNVADFPFGEGIVADLFRTVTTGNVNSPLKQLNLVETIPADTSVTIAFYAKNVGAPNYAFRISAPQFNEMTGIVSNQWKRYELVIDTLESATSTLLLETRGRVLGDSILFAGFSVNYGAKALPLVTTYATGINQDSIANIGGNITFTGDLQRADRAEATASETTDASGDVVVTHNLGFAPTNISITPISATWRSYTIVPASVNDTSFTVRFWEESTMAIQAAASEAVEFYWSAE